MHTHTIGQLARRAGLPTSTLRYYERAGLLKPNGRTPSNYRFYSDDALERIRFIRIAQSTGFTVADIKSLLEIRDGDFSPCKDVRVVIEKRLTEIDHRIEEYQHAQLVLKSYLKVCKQAVQEDPCEVIEDLSDTASKEASEADAE